MNMGEWILMVYLRSGGSPYYVALVFGDPRKDLEQFVRLGQ